MHGLIFVTWEKFLFERFGSSFLTTYRAIIGETAATAPLTSRVYDDEALLVGVDAACQLTGLPAEALLRAYGCYFMINGLTSHLCAYLLTKVQTNLRSSMIAPASYVRCSWELSWGQQSAMGRG